MSLGVSHQGPGHRSYSFRHVTRGLDDFVFEPHLVVGHESVREAPTTTGEFETGEVVGISDEMEEG